MNKIHLLNIFGGITKSCIINMLNVLKFRLIHSNEYGLGKNIVGYIMIIEVQCYAFFCVKMNFSFFFLYFWIYVSEYVISTCQDDEGSTSDVQQPTPFSHTHSKQMKKKKQ